MRSCAAVAVEKSGRSGWCSSIDVGILKRNGDEGDGVDANGR